METGAFFCAGAVFLSGLLTSLSPCPLAGNLAAVSFLSGQAGRSRKTLTAGCLYALGRMTAYVLLSFCVLKTTLGSAESLTRFLAVTVHDWLGPAMILLGMMFTGMIVFSFGNFNLKKAGSFSEKLGIWSAFPLGVILAFAFCPTSVAAFLAMLGLSAQIESRFVIPCIFGIGTALPVLFFSWILAFQVHRLERIFGCTREADRWIRNGVGGICILCGIYFSLVHVWF
ncbi:MAG: sulfite exporter TauE/SafE family protein [Planctomycetia bacterium]|nr:sulfite exporter TauE/SafE family protein [Planctomycetia bacterium]